MTEPLQEEIVLRDGTRAAIRPIHPDDKERLQQGLGQLSPRSRFLRFHAPVDRFTQPQLRYLTEIDYHDHMAWVAMNPERPDEPGMGVARYVRLDDDPTVAEAAVTVLDHYQGRGLGTALLERLAESARRNGIRTLRNYVLAENKPMLELFATLGAERTHEGQGVYRIDVPLFDQEQEPARTPRDILRDIARGVLPPLHWVFPRTAFPRLRRDQGG